MINRNINIEIIEHMFKDSKKVIGQDLVEKRLADLTRGKFDYIYLKRSAEGKSDEFEKINAAYILSYNESIRIHDCTIYDINLYYTDRNKFVVDYLIRFDEAPQKSFATFEIFSDFTELNNNYPELAKAVRLRLLKEE
ncbi:MAG: hypothetical protein QXD11_02360 [Candidatus Micrarchaeaceae archaeon]